MFQIFQFNTGDPLVTMAEILETMRKSCLEDNGPVVFWEILESGYSSELLIASLERLEYSTQVTQAYICWTFQQVAKSRIRGL